MIDSTDEWIRTRSGIVERRWASRRRDHPDDVGRRRPQGDGAGRHRAGQIDTVIVSTVTHLHQTPAIATTIASELGATGAAAFDISAACAGFCYATAMADSFIRTGASKYVLIIGVERLSDMTDNSDRSTAFIFADGAGAAVIGPSDEPRDRPGGLGLRRRPGRADRPDRAVGPRVHTTPRRRSAPSCGWRATPSSSGRRTPWPRPPPRRWTAPAYARRTWTSSPRTRPTCGSPTPCSGRSSCRRRWSSPATSPQGNTSAASIPLAIEALLESGEAKSGQTCLIIGFGAGLVYAGQVIVLP